MFDDPNKELEQLQEQLLQDEEWFQRELDAAKRMIGQMPEQRPQRPTASRTPQAPNPAAPVRNYANGYGQTAPQPRRPQPVVEQEAPMPKKKGIKGLLILATIETLGIVGLAAYWALVLLK